MLLLHVNLDGYWYAQVNDVVAFHPGSETDIARIVNPRTAATQYLDPKRRKHLRMGTGGSTNWSGKLAEKETGQ
jgi:hypothetical protein